MASASDQEDAAIVIEASEVDSRTKSGAKLGRPKGKASSKTADVYRRTLAGMWFRSHKVAASFIGDELAWTDAESQEFGNLAYEVCVAHNWLRFLDNLNDAQLILFIISIEVVKVRQVLAAQTPDEKGDNESRQRPQLVTGEDGTGNGTGYRSIPDATDLIAR